MEIKNLEERLRILKMAYVECECKSEGYLWGNSHYQHPFTTLHIDQSEHGSIIYVLWQLFQGEEADMQSMFGEPAIKFKKNYEYDVEQQIREEFPSRKDRIVWEPSPRRHDIKYK